MAAPEATSRGEPVAEPRDLAARDRGRAAAERPAREEDRVRAGERLTERRDREQALAAIVTARPPPVAQQADRRGGNDHREGGGSHDQARLEDREAVARRVRRHERDDRVTVRRTEKVERVEQKHEPPSADLCAPALCRVEPIEGLTITRIETVPIRVPLARTYAGSHYSMTHRSTVITRVHTDEGVVGEAYAGDEDAGLTDIVRDRPRRDRAAPRRPGRRSPSSAAGSWRDRRPTTSCATAGSASSRAPASTRRSGTRSARRSASRSGGSGAATATALPMISIGGYYGAGDDGIRGGDRGAARLGLAGLKFKVGGRAPEEDAARFRVARDAAGPRLRPRRRRQPGLDAGARRSASPGSSRTPTSRGSRSRAAGRTTGAPCATCATAPACASAPGRASTRPPAAAT